MKIISPKIDCPFSSDEASVTGVKNGATTVYCTAGSITPGRPTFRPIHFGPTCFRPTGFRPIHFVQSNPSNPNLT